MTNIFGRAEYVIGSDISQLLKGTKTVEEQLARIGERAVEVDKVLSKIGQGVNPEGFQEFNKALDAIGSKSSVFDKIVDKTAELRALGGDALTRVSKSLDEVQAKSGAFDKIVDRTKELRDAGGSAVSVLTKEMAAFQTRVEATSRAMVDLGKRVGAAQTSRGQTGIPGTELQKALVAAAQAGQVTSDKIAEITARAARLNSTAAAMKKNLPNAESAQQVGLLDAQMVKLTGSATKAGTALGQAKKQVHDLSQAAGGGPSNRVAGFLKRFTGAFDRFSQSIEESTGIAESDIAILLGAGLAGGFAGVIRVVQKFVTAIGEALAQVNQLNRAVARSFGDSADEVEKFSQTTAHSLGLSTTEALQTEIAFQRLSRQLRFTGEEALNFDHVMTLATGAVERSIPGIDKTEEAQKLLEEAVKGSSDALSELEVTLKHLNDSSKEVFGTAFFSQLSEAQQNVARTNAVLLAVEDHLREAGRAGESFGDIIRNAGRALGDFFTEEQQEKFKAASEQLERLKDEARDIDSDLEKAARNVEPVGPGLDAFPPPETIDEVERFKRNLEGLGQTQLFLLRQQVDAEIKNKALRIEMKKAIDAEIEAIERQVDTIEKARKKWLETQQAHQLSVDRFRESRELQQQALAAERALQEAILDGARRVADAEERLARTRQDNARKYRDLTIQIQRDEEDAAHEVKDAEIELQEARDEGIDRIEDAEDRLADVRKQAFREQRDIKERIEDLELDHTRKVEDLQKRIAEAHTSTSRAVLEAQLDIEAAIRGTDEAGFNAAQRQLSNARLTGDAADSRLDLERELADFERDRSRLKRDLHESEMDEVEEVRRAERDLDRARRDSDRQRLKAQRDYNKALRDQNRAIEDAIRAMSDLEVEQNRALFDAKRGLEEAQIARDRAVASAARAFQELAERIVGSVEALRELLAELHQAELSQIGFLFGAGFPGLQHGGPAHAGHPYVVGESGPELFVPNTSGRVFSNSDFIRLLQEMFGWWGHEPHIGGRDFTKLPIYITVHESGDPRLTAFQVSNHLARYVRN